MKLECMISDLSFSLEERCKLCLSTLEDRSATLSQKCYAICYLTYRHILNGYFIDREFLFKNLDYYFKQDHVVRFEEVRWRISLVVARLYLSNNITDVWWWNTGTKEKLAVNPLSIINYLRLINLAIAFNIKDDIFITTAYQYAVDLYRHFYNIITFETLPNFREVNIAENQFRITVELFRYTTTAPGARVSFKNIAEIDTTEPFNSLFRKTLRL